MVQNRERRPVRDSDILAEFECLKGSNQLSHLRLLRIYFYDARPAEGILKNPLDQVALDLSKTKKHQSSRMLLDRIANYPDVALRLGDLSVQGWQIGEIATKNLLAQSRAIEARDLVPKITQKGVDLRIGLDIARLALRQLVDTVLVVTADSDFVPAFSFARREGVRVVLDHLGHSIRPELRANVDVVL